MIGVGRKLAILVVVIGIAAPNAIGQQVHHVSQSNSTGASSGDGVEIQGSIGIPWTAVSSNQQTRIQSGFWAGLDAESVDRVFRDSFEDPSG